MLLSSFAESIAQDQCGKRDVFYRFHRMFLEEPNDSILLVEFDKLYLLEELVVKNLETSPVFHLVPVTEKTNYTGQHGYLLEGLLAYSADKQYTLTLILSTTCSKKLLGQTEVSFQMYPSWDPEKVAAEALQKLNAVANVQAFEDRERDSKKYGLGGDLWGGRIKVVSGQNKLVKGQETMVTVEVVDCDGLVLTNKPVSTQGTSGGVFTPASFTTNAKGEATVKFKLTTDQTAILKAQSEIKNVWGCQDLYTGTGIIKGISGTPVKIEIDFTQEETRTLKRPSIPGLKVQGGEEAIYTSMHHYAVLYHFPSHEALKKGYLVAADNTNAYPGSKTVNVTESGQFYFLKTVQNTRIRVQVADVTLVDTSELGEEKVYQGSASLEHPSEVYFFKGDGQNSPMFAWSNEYPASNDGVAFGSMDIVKGEKGVLWQEKKISDPKSPYKTQYTLSYSIDPAEELKEGNKAMKDLFGFDLDQLTNALDPTNPQSNMAGASGIRTITVVILSPY